MSAHLVGDPIRALRCWLAPRTARRLSADPSRRPSPGTALWLSLALAATVALLLPAQAQGKLRVLACEPEWGALVSALGGERVEVTVATGPLQDPHRIQARPSLIARARSADLLVCTGAELEIGWLPLLLQQSANPKIQPGQPGYVEAASLVRLRDVPAVLDRAQGDVHPSGNPHIQTDPRNIALVAPILAQRLAELDPQGKDELAGRAADFNQRWQQAIARWTEQAAPLNGLPVVSQHQGFPYLYAWLGLREVAVLEPKPGIEPSAAHLQQVLASLKAQPARMILRAAYQNPRPTEWLAAQAGIPGVLLPSTVGGTPEAKDLFSLFDDTIARLLAAARGGA